MAYVIFGLSLAAAALLLTMGLAQHMPPAVPAATAEERTYCAYRQNGPVKCVPCRERRDVNR